ncbi:MAG: SMC family ATPase [Deltaproteobacteria bacterium]
MVPITLSVRNFLSYGDYNTTLDFRDFDIACLCGKNGHGKSALIDALTWALWGKCRVKNKEEVIKRGAPDAWVELEFESDGIRYRIIRSIVRKKSGSSSSIDLQIYDDASGSYKPLDQGSRAQSAIEKIMKMDHNSFICSSFILQGMADEFTKRTPAERKEVLSKILELDEYEKLTRRAREHAQESGIAASTLENEQNQLETEISRKESLETKLRESRKEEEKISGGISEFESLYGKLIAEHESVKAKLENLDKLKTEKKETEKNCENLEKELTHVTELVRKYSDIVSREEQIIRGFGEYEKVRGREKTLSEKQLAKSNLERELESVNILIAEKKAGIVQKISTLRTRIEEYQKIIVSTGETLKRESEIETGFRKLGELSTVERGLSERKEEVDRLVSRETEIRNKVGQKRIGLETKAQELDSRIKELVIKVGLSDKLRKEIQDLKSLLEECAGAERKVEQLYRELKNTGEEIKVLSTKRVEIEKRKAEEEKKLNVLCSDTVEAHCPLCESPLQQEAKSALIEKLRKAVVNFDARLEQIGEDVKKLQARDKEIRGNIDKAQTKTGVLPGLNKELGEKEQSLKDSLASSHELDETRTRLELVKNEIESGEYGKEYEKELEELNRRKSELDYDPDKHKEILNEVDSLRKFETEFEILKKDRIRRAEAERDIKKAQKELEPLNTTLKDGCFALKSRERAEEIRAELMKLGYDEKEHGELRVTLRKLEKFSEEKQTLEKTKLSLTHSENELNKLKASLNGDRIKLEKINKEISAMKIIESRSKEIRGEMSNVETRINLLKEQKNGILMEISRSESGLERIEELSARKKQVRYEIKNARHEFAVYQELAKAFGKKGVQALIIEHAVPEIEIEANKLLNRLTEGSMALSLEMVKPTQKGGEKETLEIYIGDSSGTRSYETFSGGEAFRIDFALRVAISKFIANRSGAQLRTLVIDEGFGTQDKDGLSHFVNVINSVKDDFDKILAITHVDELKERFPVRIEVTKEPGSGSRLEVIYA